MARGATHGEHRGPRDVEHLAAHQVQHVRANLVNEAPVPLTHWQPRQQMMVLVIAVDKTRGPGLGLKPVEPVFVGVRAAPYKAKVAGNDDNVIARQRSTQWPNARREATRPILGNTVNVSGNENRHQTTPPCCATLDKSMEEIAGRAGICIP